MQGGKSTGRHPSNIRLWWEKHMQMHKRSALSCTWSSTSQPIIVRFVWREHLCWIWTFGFWVGANQLYRIVFTIMCTNIQLNAANCTLWQIHYKSLYSFGSMNSGRTIGSLSPLGLQCSTHKIKWQWLLNSQSMKASLQHDTWVQIYHPNMTSYWTG